MNRKERKPGDTNRDITKRPRSGKGWCIGCDLALVGDGQKCPVCGTRCKQKRNKKDY